MGMAGALAEAISYRPTWQARVRHKAKKTFALLVYAGMGVFVVWLVGPSLASDPSPSLEYMAAWLVVVAAFIVLGFLFVVTWNERLACIEDGRLTWPFPFRKESGIRTRYIALEEIASAELATGTAGRRGADLTLRDGTQMFLPQKVSGVDYSDLLQVLVQYVKERTAQGPSESLGRG